MPLLALIPWVGGAVLGGLGVYTVSDTAKKLATAALVGGVVYYLYKKG